MFNPYFNLQVWLRFVLNDLAAGRGLTAKAVHQPTQKAVPKHIKWGKTSTIVVAHLPFDIYVI